MTTLLKKKKTARISDINRKVIENHKKIVNQLREAAELHLEAVNHLENNDYESAFQVTANV
jgi:hypothetical protein